jgi:hypothetical protein
LCSHIEIKIATWKTKATSPGMDTGSVAVHELAKRIFSEYQRKATNQEACDSKYVIASPTV